MRADPEQLLPDGVTALPSSFDVVLIRDLAGKFSGRRTFLEELEVALPHFYQQVGQHLRAYSPKPPRAPASPETPSEEEHAEPAPQLKKEPAAAEEVEYPAPLSS